MASRLRLGTASWTAPSWAGSFYPPHLPESEWLAYYATRFDTVEVDATWYRSPAPRVVDAWRSRTPGDFLFALKAPQSITHEKILLDCEAELHEFLSSVQRLEGKLGPVLFQFPYFRKAEFSSVQPFLDRLRPFLELLPEGPRFALEVRNKGWVAPPLLDMLRGARVALALIDHPWMPTAAGYGRIPGIVTADFLYVRWLGDRHGIEEITTKWDTLVIDRLRETRAWVQLLRQHLPSVDHTYGYYNNHYAGSGFQSAQLFLELWEEGPAE